MSSRKRAGFVPLRSLLQRRYPALDDPTRVIRDGLVAVNGAPALNPHAQVRADATVRVRHPRPQRGTIKLAHALRHFRITALDAVALDLGAAAGGFTQALLEWSLWNAPTSPSSTATSSPNPRIW